MKYLIDANIFAKKAFDIAYPIVAGHNDHERGLTLSGIAQLLDEMQPVEAVPVRHGKWENSRPDAPMFGFYYCSLCGRKRTSPQDRYCPNCGARMDEE